jgi:hypothetical protein
MGEIEAELSEAELAVLVIGQQDASGLRTLAIDELRDERTAEFQRAYGHRDENRHEKHKRDEPDVNPDHAFPFP